MSVNAKALDSLHRLMGTLATDMAETPGILLYARAAVRGAVYVVRASAETECELWNIRAAEAAWDEFCCHVDIQLARMAREVTA